MSMKEKLLMLSSLTLVEFLFAALQEAPLFAFQVT